MNQRSQARPRAASCVRLPFHQEPPRGRGCKQVSEQARKNLSTDRARRSVHELLLERKIMARLVDMVTA